MVKKDKRALNMCHQGYYVLGWLVSCSQTMELQILCQINMKKYEKTFSWANIAKKITITVSMQKSNQS